MCDSAMLRHELRRFVIYCIMRLPRQLLRFSPLVGVRISKNLSLGLFLYNLCIHLKPSVVVETGTAFGVSTSFILRALQDNGHGTLYSIDLPNATTSGRLDGKQTGYYIPKRLRHRWNLTLGDSRVELPKLLAQFNEIDLFIHDSLHTPEHMLFEYRTAWPLTKALVSDDVSLVWPECRQAFSTFAVPDRFAYRGKEFLLPFLSR